MALRSVVVGLALVALGANTGCSSGEVLTDTGPGRDVQAPQDAAGDVVATDVGGEAATDAPGPVDARPDAPPVDGGAASDHLLITEVGVQTLGGEFVEIANRGATAVDLTDYYLSDNASYYTIASGMPWNPPTMNPGTDFLVRFPAGATIPPGGVVVVATDASFEMAFRRCPDFVLAAAPLACTSGMARAMLVPTNGGLGTMPNGMLSNAREMVVLFRWSGSTAERLQDVDYVTWGDAFDDATRADKTAVAGYLPDTARAMQHPAPLPGPNESLERCAVETGEVATGGNGITGHDETSERLDMSFRSQATPTPGVRNGCL